LSSKQETGFLSAVEGEIHTALWTHGPNKKVFSDCQKWLYDK